MSKQNKQTSRKTSTVRQAPASKKKTRLSRSAWITIAVACVIALAAIGVGIGTMLSSGGKPAGSTAAAGSTAPVRATIEVQDYGAIEMELYPDIAPITVQNFTDLARSGFYDGLTFHRIISGFMIQGGDPNGNGTGGSGKNIKGEFSANGVQNPLSHTRGVVSMARASSPDSASSQFFIMHQDGTYLDGNYAAFGRVTSGMEVVDAICANTPVTDGNGTVEKQNQPVITRVTIQ